MEGRETPDHSETSSEMTASLWLLMDTREAGESPSDFSLYCIEVLPRWSIRSPRFKCFISPLSRNIYSEASKADDVQFILDLIAKVGAEIPAADMENVNIAGTSNGAALTYQIIINTGADRPFRRSVMVLAMI